MSEKRTRRVSIKLTPDEFETISQKAYGLKMDISNLARLLLLNAQIKISLA